MSKDIYQGDPRIVITEEGADIPFPGNGGQPEMEQGVENLAILSLFTKLGWPGNFYFNNINNQVGSDYQSIAEGPITLTSIEALRQSTLRALKNSAFGDVESTVTILSQGQIKNKIIIKPPGQDIQEIILEKNGLNWIFQADKGQQE